jgi:cytochrome P450
VFLTATDLQTLTGPVCERGDYTYSDAINAYLITDYQQVRESFTDPQLSRQAAAMDHELMGPALAMSVTEYDGDRHAFLRGLVGHAFSARNVSSLAPTVATRAARLAADMRRGGKSADLVTDFSVPLAFETQCDVLGVPQESRAGLLPVSRARLEAAEHEFYDADVALYTAVVEALGRLRDPGVFQLLQTAERAGRLSIQEFHGSAASFLFDGYVLAAAQLSLSVLALLTHDQWHILAGNLQLLPTAVEELLRFTPSITLAMPRLRFASQERERVVAAVGVANRNPDIFPHPDALDLRRSPNPHLSFGRGIHHCIGAHLMRLQLHEGLRALLTEMPHLHLAISDDQLHWTASHRMRHLHTLHVTWP